VDASERSVEDNKDHYVVYLDEADKAVCMAVDPEVHSYGYNIIAHITSP
jgi:methanogenic corrinoid protein MtbC1